MALTKVSGDVLDSGISVAGVVTATAFDGPFRGGSGSDIIAGIGTFTRVDINGDADIDGQTELDDLNVAGVSTFAGALDINANIDMDGNLDLDGIADIDNIRIDGNTISSQNSNGVITLDPNGSGDVNVEGPLDVNSNVDISGFIDVDGQTTLDDLNVAGISTLAQLKMGSVTATSILDEDNMASNSATALATQQSIKAYVDNQVTAQDLDFQADSGGALSIDLDSEVLGILGTSNEIETSGSGNNVTIGLPNNVTVSGNLTVGGVLQYEDVVNIDSIGIVTARTGVHIDDSITHIGDTNTKIRFPSADTFSVETAGSERLRVASDGDLTLTGADNVEMKMKCGTSSGNNILAFLNSGGTTRGNITYDSDNDFLLFNVNQAERLRITSVGDALFGNHGSRVFDDTSGTNVVVDVFGGTTAGKRGILSLSGRTGDDNADIGTIWFANENNAQAGTAAHNASKLVASIDVKSETTDSNAGSDSGGHMIFSTKAEAGQIAERLRIASTGELTMTDGATKNFIDVSSTNNGTRGTISMKGKTSGGAVVTLKMGGFGDTQRGEIFTLTNHALGFATNNAATQMILSTAGNFGLGTNSPTSKFDVHMSANSGINFTNSANNAVLDFRSNSVESCGRIRVDESSNGGFIDFYNKNTSGTLLKRLSIHNDGTVEVNPGNSTSSGLFIIGKDGSGEAQLRFSSASNNTASIRLNSSEELGVFYGGTEVVHINSTGTIVKQIFTATNTYAANDTTQCGYQSQNLSDTTNTYSALRLTAGNSSPATAQIASIRKGAGQNDLTFQLETGNTAFEALRITSAGKLGLGIASPNAMMQIVSHQNAETDRFNSSNYHLMLQNAQNDTGEAVGMGFAISDDTDKVGAAILHERSGGGSAGSLQFYTNSDGASVTERVRITENGNIGINGMNPGSSDETIAIQEPSGGAVAAVTLSHLSGGNRHGCKIETISGANQGVVISNRFNSSFTERLRITQGGCLSLNSNSPDQGSVPGIHINSGSNDDCRITFKTPNKSNCRIGYYGLSNRFGMDVCNGFEIRDATASFATRFRIDSNGDTLIKTVPGANSNHNSDVLFQTSAGLIDGGSGLVYNPAEDALKVNGNNITSQTFRGAGDDVTLSAANSSSTSFFMIDAGTPKIQMAADKVIMFSGGIGEIGNVTGFQATNTAGSANTDFGIRATTIRFATGSAERLRVQDDKVMTMVDIKPNANGTLDLGASGTRWANIYTSDIDLSNESKKDKGGNEVDGTWGAYTIQEGENDLFLINRRSGKKYKFNLTEVG